MSVTLLRGGNVLDAAAGRLLERHDVVIEGNRIAALSATPLDIDGATVIDVTGKTVMPGMIDCHVHVLASHPNLGTNASQPNVLTVLKSLPIMQGMLNRGFTTVRDAGGADWALQQAIEQGVIPGPRIFPSGKALSQTGGHGDFRPRSDTLEPCSCAFRAGAIGRVVDGVDPIRLAVREEIQKGATQQYSEDEIRAAVAEAEAARTYVMAHAYTPRAIARAVRCGVRTIEHGNLCDAETAKLMAEKGAYVVPTLVTYDALAKDGASLGLPPESVAKVESVQRAGRESLSIYRDAGVKMGFGSDLLGDMHKYQSDELTIRADVLGAAEALRSATVIGAEILNRAGELGVIAPGALADVLVVEGNPLESIEVLTGQGENIRWVFKDGKVAKQPE